MRRATKHGLVLVATTFAAFASVLFAFPGTASAHEVTSITADCTYATVNFADFPDAGVMVHIAAAVEGHGTSATDVLVDSKTSVATLDISSNTAALFGATAKVDVDVTWTLEGPQHVHESESVTCGTATTTSPPTSTTMPTTTTSPTSTSPTTMPVVAPTVGSSGRSETTGTGEVEVEGATATLAPNAQAPNSAALAAESASAPSGTLPHTGSPADPLIGIGLGAVVLGTAAAAAARRHFVGS